MASFRLIATGDVHISNELPHASTSREGRTDRLDDQMAMLAEIVEIAAGDPILVAGDLTDKANVDPVAWPEMLKAMSRGTWWIMAGNHDAAALDGGRFVTEAFRYLGKNTRYLEEGPIDVGSWRFWIVPFASLEENAATIAKMQIEAKGPRNALLLHNSVLSCKVEGSWIADKGLDPLAITDVFDRVWAGHFHTSQTFGRVKNGSQIGRYFGAPMQHRFSDEGDRRGVWEIVLHDDGRIVERLIELKSTPRFWTIDIEDEPSEARSGDYVRIEVKCTSAEWHGQKDRITERLKALRAKGYRASSRHIPVYQHTDRSRVEVSDDFSIKRLVRGYVDRKDVDVGALSRRDLAAVAEDLLDSINVNIDPIASRVGFIDMEITNIFPFGKAIVKLDKAGLVYVGGRNEDSDGADNNGSGKTSLFRALTWCLYGKTVDGETGDQPIRKGADGGSVKVRFERDGEVWTVHRSRTPGNTKLTLRDPTGQRIKRSKKSLQAEIDSLVGADFVTFCTVALFSNDDPLSFASPSCSDATRKLILSTILGFAGIFDSALIEIKTRLSTAERNLNATQIDRAKLDGAIDQCDPGALQALSVTWAKQHASAIAKAERCIEDDEAQIEKGRADLPALVEDARVKQIELDRLTEEADRFRFAKQKTAALRSKVKSQRSAMRSISDKISKLIEQRKATQAKLTALAESHCPTCGSEIDRGKIAKLRAECRVTLDSREADIAAQRKKLAASESEVKGVESKIAAAEEAESKFDVSPGTIAKLTRAISKAHSATKALGKAQIKLAEDKRNLEVERARVDPYAGLIEEAAIKRQRLEIEREKLSKRCEELSTSIALLRFWVHGFGTQGLQSVALDSVMSYLTERTNWYLRTLTDGDITGSISTQREIGSGEVRDKIGMVWTIEGVEGVTPSTGQRTKIRIAIDMALMDIASRRCAIDLIMMDEILDGLDGVGKQRMLDLLVELRSVKGTVMVITHDHSPSELFESGLLAVKRDTVSHLETP